MTQPKLKKILFVDDDDVINILHRHIAEKLKVCKEVVVIPSGVQALDFLKKELSHETETPYLIFLDIRMPVMDGFQMLDEVRSLQDYDPLRFKVVILTSSLDGEDRERATQYSDVIDFMSKPLTKDKLMSVVEKVSVQE